MAQTSEKQDSGINLQKYDTVLSKHIKQKLGGCFPMGITTGVVDDFTRELLFEEELAVKTVHDILVVLHGILKYTAAHGFVNKSV